MGHRARIRQGGVLGWAWLAVPAFCFAALAAHPAAAQASSAADPASTSVQPPAASGEVLDRVVAVVNNQAILWSDVNLEIRISVLDPGDGSTAISPRRALGQLISRALIQQQIHQEEALAAQPTKAEVDARLAEVRREIPGCMRHKCSTDAEWSAFLAAHQLTPERVNAYVIDRLQILAFIERRFQQGIRIAPQEVADYYHGTFLPRFPAGEEAPALEKVSARIEEILLQQKVNELFDQWLSDLRKQGDVEVLDPALDNPETPMGGGGSL
jgi:hypothetical protein